MNQIEFLTPQHKLANQITSQNVESISDVVEFKQVILLAIQIIYSGNPIDRAPFKQHFDKLKELLENNETVFQTVMAQVHTGMETLRIEQAVSNDEINSIIPDIYPGCNIDALRSNIAEMLPINESEDEYNQESAYILSLVIWHIFDSNNAHITIEELPTILQSFNNIPAFTFDPAQLSKLMYLTYSAWAEYQAIMTNL